jgi:hypothetical protein
MSDEETVAHYLRDVVALDKMTERYPPETVLGKAIRDCLDTFQRIGKPLIAFAEVGLKDAKPIR